MFLDEELVVGGKLAVFLEEVGRLHFTIGILRLANLDDHANDRIAQLPKAFLPILLVVVCVRYKRQKV